MGKRKIDPSSSATPTQLEINSTVKRGMPVCPESEVDKYDIGLYVGRKLSDSEIFDVIEHLWRPEENFEFRKSKEGSTPRDKRFVRGWLQTYNWLAYSKLFDGAFCVPCVFFGHSFGHNSGKLDNLYKSPLTFWTSATSKYNNHMKQCGMHKHAVPAMENFLAVKRGARDAIDVRIDNARKRRIEENRQKLVPIIKSVVFCGKQTIPLRGHRDDETNQGIDNNRGNFQELLDFRVDSGDAILQEHFTTAPKNATYRSKTTQNEIINCIKDQIQESIIEEVKGAGIFSILADETPDISKREQLAVSLRYLDEEGVVQEKFVQFVECDTGTSGEAIAEKLKTTVKNLGLDVGNVRGQGYDGASNMSGASAGVAKRIQDVNPLAIYVHCFAHRLNLCVAASCKQPLITHMMDTVRVVSEFFQYPKRAEFLRTHITKYTPEYRHETLLDVCRTRWILRIDGLERFEEMYEVIIITLQAIRDNVGGHWNEESRNSASSLFDACSEFKFLFSLVMTKFFLHLLRPLTVGLQERLLDIRRAYDKVDFVKKSLASARAKIESIHDEVYERALALAAFTNAEAKMPRVCNRQVYRDNHGISDVNDYYRVTVLIPFLDHVVNEITQRFGNEPTTVVKGFSIVPEVMLNDSENWKNDFQEFVQMYEKDMVSMNTLSAELHMWETYWTKVYRGTIPSNLTETIKQTLPMKSSFPNVYTALRVLATVPVTSCECERSISVLRRLKTYLRSTMGEERLNGLALMSIHRSHRIDFNDVLDRFARQHPRRMELLDILDES